MYIFQLGIYVNNVYIAGMLSGTEKQRAKLKRILRKYRLEAGLKQEELAFILRRPQSYVSKYESGDKILNIIELVELCNALNISLSKLAIEIEENCGPE